MISHLTGHPIDLNEREREVVLQVGGVGYAVTVTRAAFEEARVAGPPPTGAAVDWWIYTHSREGDVTLYGFADQLERQLVATLMTVKGIGPGKAIGILWGRLSAAEVAVSIAAGDLAALSEIKGCGKKTAEAIVAELQHKPDLTGPAPRLIP
jgi:Holliday junction DNA helicase RuvA